jgi:hypothetical protein
MRHLHKITVIAAVVTSVLVLFLAGCQNPEDSEPKGASESKGTSVKFVSLSQNGGRTYTINNATTGDMTVNTTTTTTLKLVFDQDITGLSAADITLNGGSTGVRKGDLTKTGTGIYDLAVFDITSEGNVSVSVSKSGYTITDGPKTVTVYLRPIDIAVTFTDLTANGSAGGTDMTTKLTLTFDKDITDLNAEDIYLIANYGTKKGGLTKTGTGIYDLAISGITSGGDVTVKVSKSGYVITPESKTVTVYPPQTPDIPIVSGSKVTFISLKAAGEGSWWNTTTKLILTFDQDIADLSAANIILEPFSPAAEFSIGRLTRTGTGVYELPINVSKSGWIKVSVYKYGYTITGGQNGYHLVSVNK